MPPLLACRRMRRFGRRSHSWRRRAARQDRKPCSTASRTSIGAKATPKSCSTAATFRSSYLGRFGLNPTPAICDKARNLLRQRVKPLVLPAPNAKPYDDIYQEVADAVAAMRWLVGYGCSCDAESLAWEAMAKAYRDPGYDVRYLAELRDPKELGRVLNEDPEQFSMLTPKAHLRAWLKFADPDFDKIYREQALAGARRLDHRTADAIEMLDGEEYSAFLVLRDLHRSSTLEFQPASSALPQETRCILRTRADLSAARRLSPGRP